MYKRIIKTLLTLVFILAMARSVFAENISIDTDYDPNYLNKDLALPLILRMNNKDDQDFLGKVKTTIYETNDSAYVYISDIFIPARETLETRQNVAVTRKSCTIVVDIVNSKEEIIATDRNIVDISQYIDQDETYNNYYSISNMLNTISKTKLPDIFMLTILLIFYTLVISIILYVFLRNIDKKVIYGRVCIVISIIFTIVMFSIGIKTIQKNVSLVYISIVDIDKSGAKEKSFLNFRTSESDNYSFYTSGKNKVMPILRNSNEPIVSINFMDTDSIKYAEIYNSNDKLGVDIINAKEFDSNIFLYENPDYLDDIYNIDCSFQRFNGSVDGRVTNYMDVKINGAKLLLYGKIVDIGDIDENHSISLLNANLIGAPIGNNTMLADMIGGDTNFDIIKYYLDTNVKNYFNDGILFGFIDNNGTIDINSNDVSDVRGKTLIVKRIDADDMIFFEDVCSLENDVETTNGNYEIETNSTNGDTEVINTYTFDKEFKINNMYLETVDNFDRGDITASVPFYGDIFIYNYIDDVFENLNDNNISEDYLTKYLSGENKVTIKFVPSSKDPLYRRISLPLLRAVIIK